MHDVKPPCLDSVSEDALQCILLGLADDVQDLLRFSRVSKRYSVAVQGAENAWKGAYEVSFGALPSNAVTATSSASAREITWRERYKAEFLEAAHKMRQKLAARRLKASSAVQILEQEVYRLERNLKTEIRSLAALRQKLAAVENARRADAVKEAYTYWAPVAITRAQGSIVLQLPQNADQVEREVNESIAVGNLEYEKLRKMLSARKRTLETARSKLRSLHP